MNDTKKRYYYRSLIAGGISCGLTHTLITPIDLAKCRIQAFPHIYNSIHKTLRKMAYEESFRSLYTGAVPTLWGYSLQGAIKFSFYEVFKQLYSPLLSSKICWLSASASAEFFADILLCPFEMIKVKMMTAPNFPHKIIPSLKAMKSENFPFGSLKYIWARQIPYTMTKFYFFERTIQYFYDNIFNKKPKNVYSKKTQLSITLTSGYIAGVFCALVSMPADNIVSLKGLPVYANLGFTQIAKNRGLKLFTAGLIPRILMLGTLTGFQWFIYDLFKFKTGVQK